MKPLYPALLLLSLIPALPAQDVSAPLSGDATAVISSEVRLSRDELKELTGPIALYPDPLVALILPASTFPADIVLAARFADSNEDPALVESKPWDSSIKGLTRYPDVISWMDQNLEWTTQLGYAYLAQPDDVMDAIQDLRNQAATVGNLADTPQQRVVREETYIRIVPADPEYIYVPIYDPQVVYVERPVERSFITFGTPWLVGAWLSYDFDWHRHRLYYGEWRGGWDYHRHDHDRPDRRDHRGETVFINNNITNFQVWQGDSRRRLASNRAFAETRNRITQRTVVKPQVFVERNDRPRKPIAAGDGRMDRTRNDQPGSREGRDRVGGSGSAVTEPRPNVGPDGKMTDRGNTDGRDRDRDRDGKGNLPGERDRERAPVAQGGDGKMDRDSTGSDGRERERNGEQGKGRVAVPGSTAPTVTGDGRPGARPDRDRVNPNAKADAKDREAGKGRGSEQGRENDRPDMNGKPGSDKDKRPEGGRDMPKATTPPSVPSATAPTGEGRNGKPNGNDPGPKPQSENREAPNKPRLDPGRGDGQNPKLNNSDRTPRPQPPTGAPQAPRPNSPKPAPSSTPEERKGRSEPKANVNPPRAARPAPQATPPQQRPSAPKSQAKPESNKRKEERPQASAAPAPKPQPQARPQSKPQPAVAARPNPPQAKPSPTSSAAVTPRSPAAKPAAVPAKPAGKKSGQADKDGEKKRK